MVSVFRRSPSPVAGRGVYQRYEFDAEKRAALDAWDRRLARILEPPAVGRVLAFAREQAPRLRSSPAKDTGGGTSTESWTRETGRRDLAPAGYLLVLAVGGLPIVAHRASGEALRR